MVLVRMWNFVKRHKTKLAFLGLAVGGAYAAYQYLPRYLSRWADEEGAKVALVANKQKYFEAMITNSNETTRAMLDPLKKQLDDLVDTEDLTRQLKHPSPPKPSRSPAIPGSSIPTSPPPKENGHTTPMDKMAVWKQLKILSFSRALSALYGIAVTSVCVRLQLSILAGYLFHSATPARVSDTPGHSADTPTLSQNVKMQYLVTMDAAIKESVVQITERMSNQCHRLLNSLSLKERLSLRRLDSLVHDIRLGFESDLASLCPRLSVSRVTMEEQEDIILTNLLTETADIVQSSEYTSVVKACVDSLFASLLDHFLHHFQEEYHRECRVMSVLNDGQHTSDITPSKDSPSSPNDQSSQDPSNQLPSPAPHSNGVTLKPTSIYDVTLPLARLVPFINAVPTAALTGLSTHGHHQFSSQFVESVLDCGVLKRFAFNVYSTFTQTTAELDFDLL